MSESKGHAALSGVAKECADTVLRAEVRLEDAKHKILPFLGLASFELDHGDRQVCSVRYFFRKALACRDASDSRDGQRIETESDIVHEPLIVFFHGLGCSKYDFVGAVDRLQKANILGIDWPCTGILEGRHFEEDEAVLDYFVNSRGGFNFSAMVEFAYRSVKAILQDLGYDRNSKFILVGHSMGAKLATLYASTYPEDVVALVNVEGHLHPSDPKMAIKLIQDLQQAMARKDETVSEADVTKEVFQHLQDQFLERAPDSDAVAKWMQVMKQMTSAKGFYAQACAIVSEGEAAPDRLWNLFVQLACTEQAEATATLDQPLNGLSVSMPMTLLHVYGERNRDALSSSLKLYRSRCNERLTIREIADSGHFPFFDNPNEFWALLEEWLSQPGRWGCNALKTTAC